MGHSEGLHRRSAGLERQSVGEAFVVLLGARRTLETV
jgi:hypothetical protein